MYIVDIYSYYLLCARSQCVTKIIMNALSVEAHGIVSRAHIRGFILVECIKYHFYVTSETDNTNANDCAEPDLGDVQMVFQNIDTLPSHYMRGMRC